MKVYFDVSGRYNDNEVTDEVVEMPAVPRIGDTLQLWDDSTDYEIKHVMWTPYEPDHDAYVVLQ